MRLESLSFLGQSVFVKRFLLILLGLCLMTPALTAVATSRPNIIIAMADDMGWSDIGCYGGEINTLSLIHI